MFKLTENQQEILDTYSGGWAVVEAMPGTGKTTLLCHVAVKFLKELPDDKKVIIVTYTNSAAENAIRRIMAMTKDNIKIVRRVHASTLHSLANRIIIERFPDCELNKYQYSIADDEKTISIWRNIIEENFDDAPPPSVAEVLCAKKDNRSASPVELASALQRAWRLYRNHHFQINKDEIEGYASYLNKIFSIKYEEYSSVEDASVDWIVRTTSEYEKQKKVERILDYDDIVIKCANLIAQYPEVAKIMQKEIGIILEDEAQDSSKPQETILMMIGGEGGNWLRVGDSNQAILSSFTASHPNALTKFLAEHPGRVKFFRMSQSLRFSQPMASAIDRLSATLLRECRVSSFYGVSIAPSGKDEHPQDAEHPEVSPIVGLEFYGKFPWKSLKEEMSFCIHRAYHLVNRGFEKGEKISAAILAPTNDLVNECYKLAKTFYPRQAELFGLIGKKGHEVQKAAMTTISVIRAIYNLDGFNEIKALYEMLNDSSPASSEEIRQIAHALVKGDLDSQTETIQKTLDFIVNLHRLRIYPPEEFLMMLGEYVPALQSDSGRKSLAILKTLAATLRNSMGYISLRTLAEELEAALKGKAHQWIFDLEEQSNTLTPIQIGTIHSAKGMEWDHVFVLESNQRYFPLDRESVIRHAKIHGGIYSLALSLPAEGEGIDDAIGNYIKEKASLMYVAATRGRKSVYFCSSIGEDVQFGKSIEDQELHRIIKMTYPFKRVDTVERQKELKGREVSHI